MRALPRLCLVLLLAVAGCKTTAVAPEGALNGTWVWTNTTTLEGKSLQLTSSGSSVTGTGQDLDAQHQVIGSYTISGTYKNAEITLSMSYQDGSSATFSGHFVGTDTVQGTWTGPNGGQITLVRAN